MKLFVSSGNTHSITIKEVGLDDYIKNGAKQLGKEMDDLWAESIGLPKEFHRKENDVPLEEDLSHEGSMFYQVLLHEDDAVHNQVIGYAQLTVGDIKGSIWLSQFFIEPKYRGSGVGLKALILIREAIKAKGYKVFALNYITANKRAKKLYEKFGFNKVISEVRMMKL